MKKKSKNILIISVVLVIILGLFLSFYFLKRIKLYDNDNITGNTSGNLLNGGLFCETGDTIYFANPYDQNMLYSMNSDLSNVKKVSDDNVSYLNIAGKYMFYTKRNDKKRIDSDTFMALSCTGLYRADLNGNNVSHLYKEPTQVARLLGNYVYYQHYDQKKGLLLYRAKIDGSEDKMLLEDSCAPYAAANGTIYFTGSTKDHAIHSIKTDGSNDTTVLSGNYTGLSMQGDYLYFMDMSDNYSLKRVAVSGGNPETLISDRLATYNVSENGNTIYCQIDNGSENGLYEYDITSGSLNLLSSGDYNYLHLTNEYLFYETFDQSKLYILDLATNQSEEWMWEKKK